MHFWPICYIQRSELFKFSHKDILLNLAWDSLKYCLAIDHFHSRGQQLYHLPLPQGNINAYLSLRAKCWLKGGVGGRFPRNLNWSVFGTPTPTWYTNMGTNMVHQHGHRFIGSSTNMAAVTSCENIWLKGLWKTFLVIKRRFIITFQMV